MKKIVMIIMAAVAICLLPACNNTGNPSTATDTTINTGDDSDDFVEEQTWNEIVSITWSGSTVTVGDLPDGVSVSNDNGYVTVTSTAKHIEYAVSGSGTGQLKFYSDYKFKLSLNGLTLACSNGPAINNQCGKSFYIVLTGNNVLSDNSNYTSSTEDQKAALSSEGQIIVSGDGSLAVTGNYKHAMASDDYIRVRGGDITLTSNVSDGMHSNDGIIINGGTVTISAAGDGIQCDTSSVVVTGGTVNVTSAGDEGILAYSSVSISGGTVTVKSVDKGIKSKAGNVVISGGTTNVTTTGDDGKGIRVKLGEFQMSNGVLNVTTAGVSAKGIKAQGDITISGGTINVLCNYSPTSAKMPAAGPGGFGGGGNPGGMGGGGGMQPGGKNEENPAPEGIESKAKLTISGGTVYSYAYDDAINSASDMTITGGYVCGYSLGNDGLDANGNCYIKGGVVYAIGSTSPEVGIDANTEKNYKLYITGGTVVAIGGLENGSSVSLKSTSTSWSSNTWYALYNGSDLAFIFKSPSSGGNTMTVCTKSSPSLSSGVTVSGGTSIFNGMGNINGTISK